MHSADFGLKQKIVLSVHSNLAKKIEKESHLLLDMGGLFIATYDYCYTNKL